MRVVIIGYGEMLTNLIAGCMDAKCNIVGVFRYDKVKYNLLDRKILDIFNPTKEFTYIKSHKIYEINARNVNSQEFKNEILKLNADLIIVGSWGEKFKQATINLAKLATINVHPSLLPKYRGPNPYLRAISNMETKSGVTFHLMDENLDTGPILHQKETKILTNDTGKELKSRIVKLAREGVKELIEKLDKEIIIPVKQDESKATYYSNITSNDVMIDFTKPSYEISAKIRGFYPWTRCYFQNNTHFFIPDPYQIEIIDNENNQLTPGTVIDKSPKLKSVTIVCGDNKLIKMKGLKLYGALATITSLYIKYRL